MGEKDIQAYLNRLPSDAKKELRRVAVRKSPAAQSSRPDTFKDFSATHLFCGHCRSAMPVRERILLYLPDGDLYEFKCTRCGASVGTRKAGKRPE